MPKAAILKREVFWSTSDGRLLQHSTDMLYPKSNGRYLCGFCTKQFQRRAVIDHYSVCKAKFLGEE